MEGLEPSVIRKTWEDLAATEMRLQLMSELLKLNVGLADVEEFNIDIKSNLKNLPSEKANEMQNERLVKAAMNIKIHDEQITRTKLIRTRNVTRTKLMKTLGRNTRKYRTVIKNLRLAARDIKANYKTTYDAKMDHLQHKYRETEEEKLDKIPKEMEEYITLSIFDRDKFDRLEELQYEITCVGDLELKDNEKSILRMHPTFSIIETLKEGAINFEQELSSAKLRMQISKEIEKEESEEATTAKSEEQEEEEDAKSRLTFEPLTKTYNDRKRRATDLEECSRITLQRPLPTNHETLI